MARQSNILSFPLDPSTAVLDAAGDELNDAGGLWVTRSRGSNPAGATGVNVETTFGVPTKGALWIAGTKYMYTAKTRTSFGGLSPPLAEELRPLTPVVHASRPLSGLDAAKNQLFVDTAEEEFLDALGSNYGLTRPDGFSDDEYRAFIMAAAYVPAGTMFALETVLDALLGEDEYTLFTDLVNYPKTVFLDLVDDDDPGGRTFLPYDETIVDTSLVEIETTEDPYAMSADSVVRVSLTPHAVSMAGDEKPSAEDDPWTYAGDEAETQVTVNGDGSIKIDDNDFMGTCFYRHLLRIDAGTGFDLRARLSVISQTSGGVGIAPRTINVNDGHRNISVDISTSLFAVIGSGGTTLFSTACSAGVHDVRIVKPPGILDAYPTNETGEVEFYLDGVLVASLALVLFGTTAARNVEFGMIAAANLKRDTDWYFLTLTTADESNFWNIRVGEDVTTAEADPDEITTAATTLDASYEGREVVLRFGLEAHGRGNGHYLIDEVTSANTANLVGVPQSDGAATADDTFEIDDECLYPFTEEDAGVQSTLTTGAGSTEIVWTARYGGVDGDSIRVRIVNPGANNVTIDVTVAGDDITVNPATNAGGFLISTANQIVAAVNANAQAAALLTAAAGGDGTGVPSAFAYTALAGGEDGKFLHIEGETPVLIATLIDERTVLVGSHSSPAGLTVASGLAWAKDPNFPDETATQQMTIVAAGTVEDSPTRLVFPDGGSQVPDVDSSLRSYDVSYVTERYGGEIEVDAEHLDTDAREPWYLYDRLDFVRSILDDFLPAGTRLVLNGVIEE